MNILLKSLTITLSLIAGLPAMENKNTDLGNCALEFTSKILTEVVKDEYINKDFTNFQESACLLKSVCSDWCQIIDRDFLHKAMVLGCQQMCPEFLKGSLIYRPKEGSDEGMIELKISDLWNPLGGSFNLDRCDNTGQVLIEPNGFRRGEVFEVYPDGSNDQLYSISTGYRKERKAKNSTKVEIWLTPRFLVEKELNTTAGHLKEIFPSKWVDSAPVGIFWNWGGWDKLGSYMYLTSESIYNLSKINVFENWKKAVSLEPFGVGFGWLMRSFTFRF